MSALSLAGSEPSSFGGVLFTAAKADAAEQTSSMYATAGSAVGADEEAEAPEPPPPDVHPATSAAAASSAARLGLMSLSLGRVLGPVQCEPKRRVRGFEDPG